MVHLLEIKRKIRMKKRFQKEIVQNLDKKKTSFITPSKKFNFLGDSNELGLKTLSYKFLKSTKGLKSGSPFVNSLGFLLQLTGFYLSKIENKKRKKLNCLRKKVLSFLKKKSLMLAPSFVSFEGSLKKPKNFRIFRLFGRKQLEVFKFLKKKSVCMKFKYRLGRSRRVLERRLLLHEVKLEEKQKYKNWYRFFFFRKNSLRALFKYYALGRLKYKAHLRYKWIKRRGKRRKNFGVFRKLIKKLRKRRIFPRLVKKWNRKKKWKKRGLFRFFRSKLKYFHYFSVPRHFEMNFKTGEILSLGFGNSSSMDLPLAFKLNIRRLTTYLSS